jgi:hypothetical protein
MQHRPSHAGRQSPPIWPFLLLLVFLFAMSITSPRHWEKFAQRAPLAPPTDKTVSTSVATPIGDAFSARSNNSSRPSLGAYAETRPRVSGNYSTPAVTSPNAAPTYAQPNLDVGSTPSTSGPLRLSGASPSIAAAVAPQLKIEEISAPASVAKVPASAEPPKAAVLALPNLGSPSISVPSAIVAQTPIVPQADAISSDQGATGAVPTVRALPQPVETPQVAALPKLEQPEVATTPKVQEYRPSPTGFLLHGGHKATPAPSAIEQPREQVGRISSPIVKPQDKRPTLAPPMTSTAKIEPRIADPATINPAPTTPTPVEPPKVPQVKQPVAAAPSVKPANNPSTKVPELVAVRTAPAATTSLKEKLPAAASLVPAKPEAVVQAPPSYWPRPSDLLDRLANLHETAATRAWADEVTSLLEELTTVQDVASSRTNEIFQQLRAALSNPALLDEQRLDAKTGLQVRLTRHALQRRLDVWESLSVVVRRNATDAVVQADVESLAVCLVDLERETAAAGETGRQWREYLQLDALGAAVRNPGVEDARRDLARQIVSRMRRAAETDDRNQFLTQGAFAQLNKSLLAMSDAEIDGRALLQSIERFEGGGLPSDGHALAEQCRLLDYSSDVQRRQLATWLTSHYRNANIRVTISSDLLNRMLPEELRKNAPVNDTVLGMPTQGWSSTRTGIGIAFLPSNDRLAMRMTAEGVVHAQTQTFSGPVRLFSHSDSNFRAFKDFSLTHRGVEVSPATATTSSRSRLQGIRTEFDHMPILGGIVESIALDQHAEKRVPAQREAATKVSRQVERGLDQELDLHLRTANEKLNSYCVNPLSKLGLSPELIELQSNEARAIMRVRVAGENQLASHTPRPRAYSDNVASVQVHQSAVNNILERLGFQGRTFTAAELYQFAVTELYVPDVVDSAQIPSDIEVKFAKVDPISIHCANGHIELRLAIEELRRGAKTWRDFVVRTEFKTAVVDGATCFVRDGMIHLSGNKLSTTSQIALRTVFAKVFADEMCLPLWPEKLRSDKRFEDLDIAQVDIRDGWIGMAVGPRRVQTTMGLLRPRR